MDRTPLASLLLLALVAGTQASTPITPGGAPLAGTLGPEDLEPAPIQERSGPDFFRDLYTFQGTAGRQVTIDLVCEFDGYLFLLGPSGQVIASNDDFRSTGAAHIQTTLQQSGTHTVVVTSFSAGAAGAYQISVSSLNEPPAASRDERISLGQTVQGTLEEGDAAAPAGNERSGPDHWRDGYTFRGRQGQSVVIDMASPQFDGYLYLVGPGGQVIASNDDFGTVYASRIIAPIPSSGSHRIVVTSFSPGQGGAYTLSLGEAPEQPTDPNAANPGGFDPRMHPEMMAPISGWQPPPDFLRPQAPHGTGTTPRRMRAFELLMEPLNQTCHAGERFVTSVALRSSSQGTIDRLRICLVYDPQALRPLRVSDHKIRPLLAAPATLRADLHTGRICYEAALAAPFKGAALDLLGIEWQALQPAARTRIAFHTGAEDGSALWLGDRDLLGGPTDPGHGVVGTDVTIRPTGEDALAGTLLIDGHLGPAPPDAASASTVALRLAAPATPVRPGQPFGIEVHLVNPRGLAIDELRFGLAFDPRVFEALDAAPGGRPRSGSNWIVRGVNLLDAPFHEAFPFDLHLHNEVAAGRALYHMRLSQAQPLPSGPFARLLLRARVPGAESAVRLLAEEIRIRSGGVDLNGHAPDQITLRVER